MRVRSARGVVTEFSVEGESLDDHLYVFELAIIRFEIEVSRSRYAAERKVPELVDLRTDRHNEQRRNRCE